MKEIMIQVTLHRRQKRTEGLLDPELALTWEVAVMNAFTVAKLQPSSFPPATTLTDKKDVMKCWRTVLLLDRKVLNVHKWVNLGKNCLKSSQGHLGQVLLGQPFRVWSPRKYCILMKLSRGNSGERPKVQFTRNERTKRSQRVDPGRCLGINPGSGTWEQLLREKNGVILWSPCSRGWNCFECNHQQQLLSHYN